VGAVSSISTIPPPVPAGTVTEVSTGSEIVATLPVLTVPPPLFTSPLSNSGSAPDGGAFTDFLAKLNDPVFGAAATQSDVTGCFAGHCDWRLPNIVELQTILDTPCPAEVNFYCIDPIFGPSQSSAYWSASSNDLLPGDAWFALFFEGAVGFSGKGTDWHARAVRVGSCH
jgi:hypothetical protein